ncbi:nuclease-related domain-containing protein [Actinomadura macrotermitis]|uniref:NERD domain-containing protein n=1 Tax=Actinomadura macrotermitis TaxID=2585200 RepID=A0A7K0BXL7_9ACTN|nr:nuclease-related domain-containing protein [Actinomadura macrotermitis]MQY05925.1 hypothetical protein [Actinomadura macrotermitis]
MRSRGDAGASARARYRALVAEHRRERLLVRALVAAGAGVVAAGLGGWTAGTAAAVAVFAGHAACMWARPGPMSGWRQGARAERATGRRLARLDPAGYRVLHDRALPGAATNIDHLVIGLTGVYVIASRHRRRFARTRGEQERRAAEVAARIGASVAALLSAELDYKLTVVPLVAVHGAQGPRGGTRHGDVLLLPVKEVAGEVAERRAVFSAEQVATIADAAARVFPVMRS